jgi:spore germination protein YaaH
VLLRSLVVIVLAAALAGVVVVALTSRPTGTGQNAGPSTEVTPPMRIGYVPYWDQERGFDVVRQNLHLFDGVSPVWYALDESGRVVLADAENTTVDARTVRFLQARGIRVLPTATNLIDGEWNPGVVQAMLHDDDAMRRHVRELVELAVEHDYDGIDIDYENLRARDRSQFTRFVERLASALHAEGKLLTAAVHPKASDEGDDERNEAQDYNAIGAAVDQLRVMTYEYSWETSPPGPGAPTDWVEEVIAWTVTQVPREKVVLGVVLLGYDWTEGRGTTVDFEQAQARADEHRAIVRRAPDGTPWFRYRDSSGRLHEVWYEDAASAKAKLELVSEYGLGGVFFWRLGGEDPNVWPVASATLRR